MCFETDLSSRTNPNTTTAVGAKRWLIAEGSAYDFLSCAQPPLLNAS